MADDVADKPGAPPRIQDYGGTGADLANWCDISIKTVEAYVQKGLFKRLAPNTYALRANVHSYIQSLRKAASGRNSTTEQARAKLIEAQARHVDLKAGELDGRLVSVFDFDSHVDSMTRAIRASVLSIPSRLAAKVPGLSREVVHELDQEVRQILTELGKHGYHQPGPTRPDPLLAGHDAAAGSEIESVD